MDRRRWIFGLLAALLFVAVVDVYSNGVALFDDFGRAFEVYVNDDLDNGQSGIAQATYNVDISAVGVERLRLDHTVGNVDIEGADTDTISVTATVRASETTLGDAAWEYVEQSRVIAENDGTAVRLHLEVPSRLQAHRVRSGGVTWSIIVPSRMALDIEADIGEVGVRYMAGAVRVNARIGEVRLQLNDAAPVDVTLNVGSIDVMLSEEAFDHDVEVSVKLGTVDVDDLHSLDIDEAVARRSVRGTFGSGSHPLRIRLNVGEVTMGVL